MRRLVVLAGCTLALAGCGGGGSSSSTDTTGLPKATLVTAGLQPPDGCYVTIFIVENATKAQIQQLQDFVVSEKAVSEVAFVSRGLALERFGKKNPKAAKGMHVNPFSDQFEAVPRTKGAAFAIIEDFATHGGPITNVRPSPACDVSPAG